ncbi:hypothetical protein [Streptomyces sp.]|uniref:hypothetical protein n=1 Tax=Streptomyces sp. TaxID=1931 RepID=UPI002D7944C6|nr:hypothetical protein [Streptomyces sp.]HET6354871.1 hypothetical protein [Streptomyces sp.]
MSRRAPPRGSCGECGCRIILTGPALEDGFCRLCRTELTELGGRTDAATPAVTQPERRDWSQHLALLAAQPLNEDVAS